MSGMGQVFSGATALAGLLLVFLGGLLNSYESFDTEAKTYVVEEFRLRAGIAFAGFIAALVAAITSLVTNWFPQPFLVYLSLGTLGVSFVIVIISGWMAVRDIR